MMLPLVDVYTDGCRSQPRYIDQMTAPARTETYEVVAPKGAILRAKADKSSEMLGVLAAGSLVDVDRTMKLQICGTRRARVVAPLAGVPHAWVSLKILARRRGAAAGAAAADGDAEAAAAAAAAAACEAAARACRARDAGGAAAADAALEASGFGLSTSGRTVALGAVAFAGGAGGDAARRAVAACLAARAAATARDGPRRAPATHEAALRDCRAGLDVVSRNAGDDALKAALLAGGAGALHALGRFVEAGNWWRRSGQRKRSPKATSGAAHAKRLEDVLDRAAMDLRQAEAHAHLLDPTDWVLNACEALEDLAREAPACVGALRRCVLAHAALRRWDGLVAFAKAQLGGGGPAFYDGDGDDAALARGAYLAGLARAGDFDGALALLEGEAPEEDPVDPFGRTALLRRRRRALLAARDGAALGAARAAAGDAAGAEAAYAAALGGDGDHPLLLFGRGAVLEALGRWPEAAAAFAAAARARFRFRAAELRAGRALARCGRPGDAAPHFAAYLRGGHDPAVAEELRAAARAAAGGGGGGAAAPPLAGPAAPGTHYAALGAAYDDTADALKRKYRAVALRCHPDKTKAPGAEDEFKRANAAYEVLSDPAKRREYDERLRRGR